MYLRLSLTDRCNLRCTYCLPENARFSPERAATGELMRLTELVVAAAGVRKIRLTGGEPTLCDDLVEHVRHARALVPVVGMTSNGVLLEPMLADLHDAGLSKLNISLDAADADGFRAAARRPGFERVLGSIRAALRLGFDPLRVNCVATQGTGFAALVRLAVFAGVHLRFIELMAIGEARAGHARDYISSDDIRARLYQEGFSLSERPEHDAPTSRVWQIDGHPVEQVSLGFITTVSHPFCGTCDRLRLSSRGMFHTCLFDERGSDLLTPLRAGDEAEVTRRIRQAVAAKKPPASFVRANVMADIGG